MAISPTDLTQRPPRSARTRLGGYAILPRMIDKCRAILAGTGGEFHYNCPLDQHFISFVGLDPEAFKAEVAKGSGDGELLAWIQENVKIKRAPYEIVAWTQYQENRIPTDSESRKFYDKWQSEIAPQRADIGTWFDLLDLDDHVSFGGKV